MKEILCIQVLSWVRVAFTQWYRFSTKVCEFSCSALENILTGSKSLSSCCFSFIQFFLCLSLHYPRFQSTLDFQQKRKKKHFEKTKCKHQVERRFSFWKKEFLLAAKKPKSLCQDSCSCMRLQQNSLTNECWNISVLYITV